MQIDLTRIKGEKKKAWWFNPADGTTEYIGEFQNQTTAFQYDAPYMQGADRVLIVTDAEAGYLNN